MRKVLCLLLSCVLLLGVCAPFAFAIKEAPLKMDGPEIVIFEKDFENDTVGEKPTGFKSTTITDVACLFVAEDKGNKVLKTYHGDPTNPDESQRAPRVETVFNVSGLHIFDVTLDAITSGSNTGFVLFFVEPETKTVLGSMDVSRKVKEWSEFRVNVNLDEMKITGYKNGEQYLEKELAEYTGKTMMLRMVGAAYPEEHWAMMDNLKISTTQVGYDPNPGIVIDDIDAPYNEADAKEESGDVVTLIAENYDAKPVNELYKTEYNTIGFTKNAVNDLSAIRVEAEEGNNYAVALHGGADAPDAIKRSPRLGRALSLTGVKTLVADMDVCGSVMGDTKMSLRITDTVNANKILFTVPVPTAFKKWTHVKVRFDFDAKTAKVYAGGKLYEECAVDLAGASEVEFQVYAVVAPDKSIWKMDNFKLTTPNVDLGGVLRLDGTVNFDRVKLPDSEATGMLNVMKMTHPRLFTDDWQAVCAKIDTDETYQILKRNIITYANTRALMEPTKYYRNARNTINDCSTSAKVTMLVLSAAYKLTGEARYKDRLYAELETVGNWPDWGADAYLCTAHLNLGFAVAYDWLYHDWTEAQRANIEKWLLDKGLTEAVLGYEGYEKGTKWVNRSSNWNNVCNGSNMIAALAIADKYPNVADYILRKGAVGLTGCFDELSPEGAYAESVGYWDYGIRHQVKVMAALDSCLQDGAALPAILDFKNITGLNNTADFPIYFNGTAGGFNYGDGDTAFNVSPILYWLATKYDKPQYAWYNLNMASNHPAVELPRDRDAIWALLWYDPEHTAKADPAFTLDKFYASTAPNGNNSLSMRGSWADNNTMVVMAHAGDATTGHMHHDAGGFVLDWAGKRWVHMYGRTPGGTPESIVYGWPKYHDHLEAGGHYDYYHTRGEGNNTIIANPKQGKADMKVDYYAPLIRSASGANTAFGIIDMTDTNADYASAKRGFMLTDMRETLVIQDEITANKPSEFYWFTNTLANITLSADGKSAILEMDGDSMLVRITQGPAEAKLGVMAAQPLPTSPNPSVQPKLNEMKLFIHVANAQTLNLTVEFVPLHDGEGVPTPQPIVALDNWSVEGSPALTTSQTLGNIVALKVDNPNAYAKGEKTYVDTNNIDIKPIVENGRTLVPVRFIAEKFGATVGWNDATQAISVDTNAKSIRLQLGSNQMTVDGNAITLDVPAKEIGGRTLIPLRALVEALGKNVHWDDRGLILITDKPANYDAETINKLIDLLDIRVQIDGKELTFFDSEVYDYNVAAPAGTTPFVTASATAGAVVTQGNPAVVTVGGKNYKIHFVEDVFESLYGGPDAIRKITVEPDNGPKPSGQNYISIQSATSSIEFTIDKYPMNGTYDGIINDNVTLNRWSANGPGNWIAYDLGEAKTLHSIAIAGFVSSQRSYTFEIAVSNDNADWTVVNPGAVTTYGSDRDVFKLGNVSARYVRLTGLAATNTTWMGISEVRIYGDEVSETADQASWSNEFYPGMIHGLVGDMRKVVIKGVNGRGESVDVNFEEIKITSMDAKVATVDGVGNVTLVGAGATEIVVEATVGGMQRKYTIPVRVQ